MPAPGSPSSALRRERIVHTASNHEEAAAWDLEQHVRMTPDERRAAARTLKVRAYGGAAPDVRASTERA